MNPSEPEAWAPIDVKNVSFDGGFWGPRLRANREATLAAVEAFCRSTGRVDALKLAAKAKTGDGDADEQARVHPFYDSDVAKWLEGVAYAITGDGDGDLVTCFDEVVDLLEAAQRPDGYLNSYYSVTGIDRRFTNLRDMHELYCAGHLIEAAVAGWQATGKRKLLEVMCRYMDLIDATFGPAKGKLKGYPGHEEIELALVKLYGVTGDPKHLALASYFVDQRGQKPLYFEQEALARGEDAKRLREKNYHQSDQPVRQQRDAEGHAVRALYLYSAMADLARLNRDDDLLKRCRALWDSVTRRRMYVTGGIGSCHHGEKISVDHDLPNEQAYAETCAAIALVFFAHRMLHADRDEGFKLAYADVMEQALYNGVISGVSLDGRSFFYDNYLASKPPYHAMHHRRSPERQQWFNTACCPTNIVRLLGSLGRYACSIGPGALAVHLYIQGRIAFEAGGHPATLTINSDYPWREDIQMKLALEKPAEFELLLRIPGWCEHATLTVNGQAQEANGGYVSLRRLWHNGDTVSLTLAMPPRRLYAHPSVRHDAGRTAVARGPVIYCLEQVDNGADLNALALPRGNQLSTRHDADLLGGVTVIQAKGARLNGVGWDNVLYRTDPPTADETNLTFVPYARWANRGAGEMIVWVRETTD